MSFDASAAGAVTPDASRRSVAGAIRAGADKTGASFQYLLATAKMESDFIPTATATTSSAKGLYQFIEQTWLGTVKEAGAKFGYGNYADAITRDDSGRYSVSDAQARKDILKLRDDPAASAAMAGVLTQSNSFKLTGMIGRRPNDAELYMAHFMGVSGASRLINGAEATPNASAVDAFPKAAAANPSIFYDRAGRGRSVSEVYANLSSRYQRAAEAPVTRTAMANLAPATEQLAATAIAPADASFLSRFPDARGAASASSADAASSPPVRTASAEPMFRNLFQAGDRAEAVSSAVQDLWAKPRTNAPSHLVEATPRLRAPNSALDLFSDRSGAFSG